jgi:peptidoglycan/xylan/chitin deacetylase (PgdA/CDA1 family)
LLRAQEALEGLTGDRPIAIAYPNGGHNDLIVRVSSELGLKVGVTIRPEKQSLPLKADSPKLLRLGRFFPHDESPMASQCRTYRSDFLLYGMLRGGYLRLARKQIAQ